MQELFSFFCGGFCGGLDFFFYASDEEGEFVRFSEFGDGEAFVAGVFEAGADVVTVGFSGCCAGVENHEAIVEGGGFD